MLDSRTLARIVREHNDHDPEPRHIRGDLLLGSIAGTLADHLQLQDAPDFDRASFFRACGYAQDQSGTWVRAADGPSSGAQCGD